MRISPNGNSVHAGEHAEPSAIEERTFPTDHRELVLMRQKIKEALACPENDIHWYNGEFADCCRALAESASETFASLSQKAAGQTVYGYCSGRMAVIRNEADLVLYKAIVRSMMKSENVPILHQGYFAGPEPRALKMHAALKPEQRVVNARL